MKIAKSSPLVNLFTSNKAKFDEFKSLAEATNFIDKIGYCKPDVDIDELQLDSITKVLFAFLNLNLNNSSNLLILIFKR